MATAHQIRDLIAQTFVPMGISEPRNAANVAWRVLEALRKPVRGRSPKLLDRRAQKCSQSRSSI